MPSLLTGFTALFVAWLLQVRVVLADGDYQDPGQSWGNDPNNITMCGISDFYNSTSLPYSFNNNKWGDDGSGFSCMNILDEGKSFSVTFKWTGDASTVKGFPYVKTDPSRLPVQLWNASTLQFSGQWSMLVEGTEDQSPQDQAVAYDNIALKANAAIDMFLSDDATNSTGLGCPIEIMIWLWYVPAILPLGHSESTPQIDTVEVAGTNFSLYHGWNAQGQHVFSWLAHQNLTSTNADYSPLLRYIWKKGLLSGALYLGQLEFGAEVMHAGLTTTFEASDYSLQLYRDGDKDDPHPKSTSTTSKIPSSTPFTTHSSTSSPTKTADPAVLPASSTTSSSSASSLSKSSLSFHQKLSCIGLPTLAVVGSFLWFLASAVI